jgi:hypothetical protein
MLSGWSSWAGPIDLIDVTSRNDTTTVTWIDTEPTPTPTPSNGRHHWPIIAIAAAVVAIGTGALVVATRTERIETIVPAAAPTTVEPALAAGSLTAQQEADAPQPPVEVTACIMPGPAVHAGTNERVVVPLSDGEMTIVRERDTTFRQVLYEVSDPRLEGTLYQAWAADVYTLPGNEAEGPVFVTFTDRIENDEGAWQGSSVILDFPDGTGTWAPLVMTGEGAYEGLTAIVGFKLEDDECVVRGYIIEGAIPAPPVPQTGQ